MKSSLLFFSFFLLASIAAANINISIQSDNNLSAEIKSISDFSTVASINQTESIDLPYNSYEIDISTDTTSISYSSFWGFLGGLTGRGVFLILIVFVLYLIYALIKGLK